MSLADLQADFDAQQGPQNTAPTANSPTLPPSSLAALQADFDSQQNTQNKVNNLPSVGTGEAVARGVGQGLTFDKLAQFLSGAGLSGMAESGMLNDPDHPISQEEMLKIGKDIQDQNTAANVAAHTQHPLAYGAGNVAGSIPAYALAGELGGVAEAPTLLGKMGAAFAPAAIVGGTHAAINGDDNASALDQAKQTALATLASGAMGSTGELAGAGVNAAGNAITDFGVKRGIKALGGMKPQIADVGPEKAADISRWALENGVTGPLAKPSTMSDRAGMETLRGTETIDAIHDLLNHFDAEMPTGELVARIQKLKQDLPPGSNIPGMQANSQAQRLDQMVDLVDQYAQKYAPQGATGASSSVFLPSNAVRELKQELGKNTKFNVDLDTTGTAAGKRQASKDVYGQANDAISDLAEQQGNDITSGMDPELFSRPLKDANKDVHYGMTVQDWLDQKAQREASNNTVGLGTKALLGPLVGGAVYGGGSAAGFDRDKSLEAALVAAGAMGLAPKAGQMAAVGAFKGGNMLQSASQAVPTGFNALTQYLAAGHNDSLDDIDDKDQPKRNFAKEFPGN